jgi:hypothetical protein
MITLSVLALPQTVSSLTISTLPRLTTYSLNSPQTVSPLTLSFSFQTVSPLTPSALPRLFHHLLSQLSPDCFTNYSLNSSQTVSPLTLSALPQTVSPLSLSVWGCNYKIVIHLKYLHPGTSNILLGGANMKSPVQGCPFLEQAAEICSLFPFFLKITLKKKCSLHIVE